MIKNRIPNPSNSSRNLLICLDVVTFHDIRKGISFRSRQSPGSPDEVPILCAGYAHSGIPQRRFGVPAAQERVELFHGADGSGNGKGHGRES